MSNFPPFKPIYTTVGWVLAIYYRYIPNLGVDIILLTATIMLILAPLTAKQVRSMIKMQQVQPEIKKIQQRHKDDKQKANEEILKFYQEQKINPLSGCLPLLVQMPVFIALLGVLRGIQSGDHIPTTGTFSRLYVAVTSTPPAKSATMFLGMHLPTSPLKSTGSLLERSPYFLFVVLIVIAGYVQSKQTMARQQPGSAGANAQMQAVTKIMPFFLGLISLNFAAGLNVYFLTSTLWRVGQQQLVLNKIYDQAHGSTSATGGTSKAVETASRDVDDEPPPEEAPEPAAPNPNTSRNKRKRRKR